MLFHWNWSPKLPHSSYAFLSLHFSFHSWKRRDRLFTCVCVSCRVFQTSVELPVSKWRDATQFTRYSLFSYYLSFKIPIFSRLRQGEIGIEGKKMFKWRLKLQFHWTQLQVTILEGKDHTLWQHSNYYYNWHQPSCPGWEHLLNLLTLSLCYSLPSFLSLKWNVI